MAAMASVIIYHNPRCTKSRQTLKLLTEQGIVPKVIEYLKQPPDASALSDLIDMLGIEPIELIRKKEKSFKELGLAQQAGERKALIRAMAQHPILIERPIVVKGKKARLCRPPEKVLEIL